MACIRPLGWIFWPVVSMLDVGVHFYALAAESDPEARECAAQVMPKIVHIEQVEQLKVGDLRPFVRRQAPRGILIGGVHARVTVF